MSDVWSVFNDSYMKKLKRPEYWGYQPDQASGSSMLARSEEQNPWAGRNQDNAKYGQLGASVPIPNTSHAIGDTPFESPPALSMGSQQPTPKQGPLQTIMDLTSPAASKLTSDWLTKKIPELINGPGTFNSLSPEMQGFAEAFKTGAPDVYKTLGDQFGLSDMPTGTYDKLLGKALEESTKNLESSAEVAATQSIPWIGPAIGLGKDLLTGDLFKRPGQSLGTAGGALGGAALGTMIFPGVGTLLGGLLGGSGGGFLGKMFGKLF
jgi:hypothetical protein